MKYKLTIKRSEWYRGHGAAGSCLLRPDGTKCCLGFYSLEVAGLINENILNRYYPADAVHLSAIKCPDPLAPLMDSYNNSKACTAIAGVNDDSGLTESEREHALTKLFAEHLDTELTFID